MTSNQRPEQPADLARLRADLRAAQRVNIALAILGGGLAVLLAYALMHGGQLPRAPRLAVAFYHIPDTTAGAEAPQP